MVCSCLFLLSPLTAVVCTGSEQLVAQSGLGLEEDRGQTASQVGAADAKGDRRIDSYVVAVDVVSLSLTPFPCSFDQRNAMQCNKNNNNNRR